MRLLFCLVLLNLLIPSQVFGASTYFQLQIHDTSTPPVVPVATSTPPLSGSSGMGASFAETMVMVSPQAWVQILNPQGALLFQGQVRTTIAAPIEAETWNVHSWDVYGHHQLANVTPWFEPLGNMVAYKPMMPTLAPQESIPRPGDTYTFWGRGMPGTDLMLHLPGNDVEDSRHERVRVDAQGNWRATMRLPEQGEEMMKVYMESWKDGALFATDTSVFQVGISEPASGMRLFMERARSLFTRMRLQTFAPDRASRSIASVLVTQMGDGWKAEFPCRMQGRPCALSVNDGPFKPAMSPYAVGPRLPRKIVVQQGQDLYGVQDRVQTLSQNVFLRSLAFLFSKLLPLV